VGGGKGNNNELTVFIEGGGERINLPEYESNMEDD